MNFDNIDYLTQGSPRQQQAYATLTNHQILSKLERFDPILAGTIPLNLAVANSDLDIICCFTDQHQFIDAVTARFGQQRNFEIRVLENLTPAAVVANFIADDFPVEIFGQSLPTRQQLAYRHMVIEYQLLHQQGEKLSAEVMALKLQGIKTEPAFAAALGLSGNPYLELLKFEGMEPI